MEFDEDQQSDEDNEEPISECTINEMRWIVEKNF